MTPVPSPAKPASKRRPYRRAQILAAAVRLFHDRGYHATTMKDVAAEVGVTAGAIYQHYRNKQEILDVAVESATAELRARLEEVAELVEDPVPLLDALVAALVEVVLADVALSAVSRQDRPLASEAAAAAADRSERMVVAEFVQALRRARPDLPVNEVRAMVHGALGIVYSVTHTDSGLAAPAAALSLRRGITAALLAPLPTG